ncbi:MAG: hypothetical protein AAF913_00245 [Pseudomonadota bacterium]
MRRLAIVAVLALAPAVAPAQEGDAEVFCRQTEATVEARRLCAIEYRRSAELIVAYGREAGYFTEDGVDFSTIVGAFWDWRTLFGLTPSDPFVRCLLKGEGQPFDFPGTWACLIEHDPVAARMDAI